MATRDVDTLTTDGPSGARGKFAVDGPKAAFIPGPVCQGATWSRAQIHKLGRLLCREAKTKSAHVLLAPTICCARNPLGGRNFECFGEDPFLSGKLAEQYVNGVQETGEVAATAKHFVANEQEHLRFSIDAQISETALREIYLRPFEMIVNGQHMDSNVPIIKDILRDQWGYKGLVMSDWGGTNSTVESLLAGLDLEMPGPPEKRGEKLLQAIKSARSDDLLAAVDASVVRILALADKFDLLGLSLEEADRTRDSQEVSSTAPEDIQLMREVAASGIVLLKNTKQTLPLQADSIRGKQVAFIGPNALNGTPGGGGSASMNPQYLSRPMESFKAVAAKHEIDVTVKYALGAYSQKWLPLCSNDQWGINSTIDSDNKALVRVEYFATNDFTGPVVETQYRNSSNIDVSDSCPVDFQVDPVPPYSYRVTSNLVPTATGEHSFSLSSVGGSRLLIDGELVIDNSRWTELGETFYAFGSAEVVASKPLVAGKSYTVHVEAWVNTCELSANASSADANHVFAAHPSVRIGYLQQIPSAEKLISEAVALANESALAIVVLGLNEEWESEGQAHPWSFHGLTKHQLSFKRGTEVRKLEMLWQMSYLETPTPLGRLPVTWPRRYTDLPFHWNKEIWPGVDEIVKYEEDTQVGYRWYNHHPDVLPLWWFGYGLSYTLFSSILTSVHDMGTYWSVVVQVKNTGTVDGQEVVQIYNWLAGQIKNTLLVGFEKSPLLRPNEDITINVQVRKRDAAHWVGDKWVLDEGLCAFGLGNGVKEAMKTSLEIKVESHTWSSYEYE
ncbi:Glycoside hydrolase family 3 [Penicillium expansum]|nr:Glycoside hydrolase family 3 [Penicillium expansum]